MKQKILTVASLFVLIVTLAGCGQQTPTVSNDTVPPTPSAPIESTESITDSGAELEEILTPEENLVENSEEETATGSLTTEEPIETETLNEIVK